jgi:dihydrofolate reductase
MPHTRPTINIIAAMAENRVIGKDGQLPWRLPDEMKHFVRLTTGHTIVMGRKTFESIGSKPLPNRHNIVLSCNPNYAAPGIETAASIPDAITLAAQTVSDTVFTVFKSELFICGGEQAYREAMPLADHLYLTLVHANPEGDAHFPDHDPVDWKLIDQVRHETDDRHAHAFTFQHYERLR